MINRKKLGLILIIISCLGVIYFKMYGIVINYFDAVEVEKFMKEENISRGDNVENLEIVKDKKVDYVAVIEIPKINLKRGIYTLEDTRNNVSQNIEVLEGSSFDDLNMILASHSGNAWNAYFKNLYLLEEGDEIFLYYNGSKYIYIVYETENTIKNGSYLLEEADFSRLILITCSYERETWQLVVKAQLQDDII